MFTGIVEKIGKVTAIAPRGQARRITIDAGQYLADARVGESVAVNGVCLTVTTRRGGSFTVDAVEETLRRTSLGRLRVGVPVNLERALRAGDRLGGHFVQGHVDGTARVEGIAVEGEGWMVTFACDRDLLRYLVEKGSVTVEGVSLTVAGVGKTFFRVALIPHTRKATTLGRLRNGEPVNVEVDVLAKYVEQYLGSRNLPGQRGG